ncbi:hypothetical protein I6F37_32860 [Bradyrhizobium sp. NBAIM08]|nr:hypothetical protein [Bradyrhizobium sp. NBAIM08]
MPFDGPRIDGRWHRSIAEIRRGLLVARITLERILNMFETSAEVEAKGVMLATYRMTPLKPCHLIGPHEASLKIVEANDVDAHDAFNRQFHEFI